MGGFSDLPLARALSIYEIKTDLSLSKELLLAYQGLRLKKPKFDLTKFSNESTFGDKHTNHSLYFRCKK